MIRIAVIGSTGSIGVSALNVARRYPDKIKVEALVAGNNIELLTSQIKEFSPSFAGIYNTSHKKALDEVCLSRNIKTAYGNDASVFAAGLSTVDTVVAAIVGAAGVKCAEAAVKKGKRLALANKESLVVCGEQLLEIKKTSGAVLLPVDSEHSAVFQCLEGENRSAVKKIILTASGGPFRDISDRALLKNITPAQAVNHPNWSMGKKISVDSATMMNKGLEIIEAERLFCTKNIDYIIHPESIIHSMVEYNDGTVKAVISKSSMELPISYALFYPDRQEDSGAALDGFRDMTFRSPNEDVFPMPCFAKDALKKGGSSTAALNAANEAAVELFLGGKIGFLDIFDIVEHTLYNEKTLYNLSIDDTLRYHSGIYDRLIKNS